MFEKVREIIAAQLNVDEEKITMDTSLVEDLKADSLDVVEMIMDLEEAYNIEIPDEELVNLRTVGDIAAYLESKQ